MAHRDDDQTIQSESGTVLPSNRCRALGDEVLLAGETVGAFEILRKVGQGGFASVYLAAPKSGGPNVAIKVLNAEWADSDEVLRRFLYEVRALARLQHPNIVKIHGSSVLPDGRPYFWMEHIEGEDLGRYLRMRGKLTAKEALEVLEPLGEALAFVHDQGIVHRDLKTTNVLVPNEGGPAALKLLDFGIARFVQSEPGATSLTATRARLGTATSMAPEQIRGEKVDLRCDVYALGILAYTLISGRRPFSSPDELEVQRMHIEEPLPPISRFAPVSAHVEQVVRRCLEKPRDARYPNVREFLEAFRRAAGSGRSAPAAQQVRAIAICVEAFAPPGVEPSEDPLLLTDLVTVSEAAEGALRAAGLWVPLVTTQMVLAVIELPSSAEAALQCAERMRALAVSLHASLSARDDAHPDVQLQIALHVGDAVVDVGPDGAPVITGAIARTGEWMPKEAAGSIHFTRSWTGHFSSADDAA